jgi:hypothetical protein
MELRPGFTTFPISFTTKVRQYNLGDTQIPKDTVLLAFRGSVAHGMFVDPKTQDGIDDVDLMGITIPEPKYFIGLSEWGSRGTKEYQEGIWDGVFYDIRKITSLLLQGNPNVMSLLWTLPAHRLMCCPVMEEFIKARHLFVGKHVFNAFAGYASAQLLKMESRDPADLRMYLALTAEAKARGLHPNEKGVKSLYPDGWELKGEYKNANDMSDEVLLRALRSFMKKGENLGYLGDKRKRLVLEHGYDSKNAAHCIRLLRMCVEFLYTGSLVVYRPEEGDDQELLAIKRGEWPLDKIKSHAEALFKLAREAKEASPLPNGPDKAAVEGLLIKTIRDWWNF